VPPGAEDSGGQIGPFATGDAPVGPGAPGLDPPGDEAAGEADGLQPASEIATSNPISRASRVSPRCR
jgi:hypothetical protein